MKKKRASQIFVNIIYSPVTPRSCDDVKVKG